MTSTIINATVNPPTPLFMARSAATCLADAINALKPNMLFSEFWHQGELAVLFGNENSGKSLLAMQLAEAISTGTPINGFATETCAQKVLYFDLDTSDRQFANRYDGYTFSENLIRVTINPEHCELRKFGEQLFAGMEAAIEEHGAKTILIDSFSALKYFVNDLFFFTRLLGLKNRRKLSVLLLAGTRKNNAGRPLSLSNLAAGKMLCGIADSVFAIGQLKKAKSGCYLIHLKGKEQGIVYHQNRVVTGRNTVTPVTGLPGFEFTGYGTEQGQLVLPPEAGGLEAKILEYRQKAPHASLAEIAKWCGTNKMKVKRVLERYPVNLENQYSESETLATSLSRDYPKPSANISDTGTKDNIPMDFRPRVNNGVPDKYNNLTPPRLIKFRSDGKLPDYPPAPEVTKPERTFEEKLASLKADMGLNSDGKELTYSQQVKKRLAQARINNKKGK